jgi:transposase
MSPQYVKPYVTTNKNDFNDAKGICEAVTRPSMHFVPIKSIAQQDIQCLHRIRSRLIQERTALVNQVRGLLGEYGIVVPQGMAILRKRLPEILDDEDNDLTLMTQEMFAELYTDLLERNKRIETMETRIVQLCKQSEVCRRLLKVEGIGPMTATALVAAIGDAKVFQNGRQMAAWRGLVPRQSSSGGKQMLLGISKRGDRYLRSLLIHGARAVVRAAGNKTDSRSRWLMSLVQRRGKFKAYVALANKNARILWALMTQGSDYRQPA